MARTKQTHCRRQCSKCDGTGQTKVQCFQPDSPGLNCPKGLQLADSDPDTEGKDETSEEENHVICRHRLPSPNRWKKKFLSAHFIF